MGDSSLSQETGMTCRNPLLDVCYSSTQGMSPDGGETESLFVKISACLWATGSDTDSIHQILRLVRRSYEHGGRRAVSGLIKGWSNAIRSLLARDYFNTSVVGHCKQPRNCRFALRCLGASPSEIDDIIARYDDMCGIPPILLLPQYWRVLLPNPAHSLLMRVIPLSNLGRACPIADAEKVRTSEIEFYKVTGKIPDFEFDFSAISRSYGRLCKKTSSQSHIPLNTHADFHSSREDGGKMEHFIVGMVDRYLSQTIDELVEERPPSDLYDLLGNLALRRDDWSIGTPITDVMYPEISGLGDGLDRRLGLFGLDAAIRSLIAEFPEHVHTDAPYLTFGPFSPNISFDGELPSRVHTLAEEGFKARVITILCLPATIVGGVARHFLDNSMRTDLSVKIGLLSKVKLYDFLVHLNLGDRRGVDSFDHPSVFFRTALSADLTTSTDTPPRSGPMSCLMGFISTVSNDRCWNFLRFAIELGCSPRGFISRHKPPDHVHRCGIMMGEGLSGTYLNVMSGIVRALLHDFMEQFDFYSGATVRDALDFCREHDVMIQDYLDTTDIGGFGASSTQSGDDLIDFNHFDPAEIRRYLILLYVIFGEVPSESTFYSSEYYATFTEETAIRHSQSLGWVFIDCIKPRLYTSRTNEGISPILSHISQITSTLKYVRDEDYINRVCDVVDMIIESCPTIRERLARYNLVAGFPPWLGGLDHPIQLIEGTEVDIPLEDRSMVMRLMACNLEELWDIKYSWVTDDLPSDEDAREIREIMIYLFRVFQSLPEGDHSSTEVEDLHLYTEDMLLEREMFPSYNTYVEELRSIKQQLGLANLDELAEDVARGLRLRQRLDGAHIRNVNPMITLRNRREFLISRTSHLEADGHDFVWSVIQRLHWRYTSSFRGKCVKRDSFLDLLDLLDLPSLSVPILTFVR